MILALATIRHFVDANWETVCTLFVIAVIVASFYIGRGAGKGGKGEGWVSKFMSGLIGNFTNVLAYVVVTLAFLGIFILSWSVLAAGGNATALDSAKFVFGAVLPLLGTWMGTVLAHYFQKENLAAATQSITDLAKGVGSGSGRLAALAAKEFMLPPAKILTLPVARLGKPDAEIPLAEIVAHLKTNKADRLTLFAENKDSGPAKGVVHLSKIEKFLAEKVLTPVAGQDLATLTLASLLTDSAFEPIFKSSFNLVKESATLAEVKVAMDNMTSGPGVRVPCYDVFITATGKPDEPVLGWITNDIINENSKV